jgi:tRNA (cmo5U34)-methyltransferase
MSNNNDQIYANPQSANPFKFDQKVAAVFPDMIKRSVPGYENIIHNIQQLASQYITTDSNCYDLGCSLGAASLAMSHGNQRTGVKIIAVDNSAAMIERCAINIDGFKHQTPIELVQADIQQVEINNASMVVLNYTLQFIPQALRFKVLQQIYQGMRYGGILLLSEKIIFSDDTINQLMIELHHQFKRENGYSELEISQKRNALETVLVPETMSKQVQRLQNIGFSHVSCYQQQLNFASFIAIKS